MILKRRWRKRIDTATRNLLESGERLVVAFPGETPEGTPVNRLIDFLRKRYRVYVVALTNSRVLILSRIRAFSSFELTWAHARSDVSIARWSDGRLALRRRGLTELDLEVAVLWGREVDRFRAELLGSGSEA
jgi:hypothetical protein